MRLIDSRDSPRRWRCLLCNPDTWRFGTFADWQWHYLAHHRKDN